MDERWAHLLEPKNLECAQVCSSQQRAHRVRQGVKVSISTRLFFEGDWAGGRIETDYETIGIVATRLHVSQESTSVPPTGDCVAGTAGFRIRLTQRLTAPSGYQLLSNGFASASRKDAHRDLTISDLRSLSRKSRDILVSPS